MYTLSENKERLNINNYAIDLKEIDYISMEKMKEGAPYEGYCVVFNKRAGNSRTYFEESNSLNGLASYNNFRTLAEVLDKAGTSFAEISGVRLINLANVKGVEVFKDEKRNCQNVTIDFNGRKAEFVGVREQDIALLEEMFATEKE